MIEANTGRSARKLLESRQLDAPPLVDAKGLSSQPCFAKLSGERCHAGVLHRTHPNQARFPCRGGALMNRLFRFRATTGKKRLPWDGH